jgi:large subunit ribosomal protein L17
MERNLVTSLLLYESIRTTQMRAKVIIPWIDRLVTVAKTKPTALAIRRINAVVTDKNACRKIIEVLKERYATRSSGMTRMTPVGARKGDGAKMVDLTLMEAGVSIALTEQNQKNQTKQRIQKTTSSKSSSSLSSASSKK